MLSNCVAMLLCLIAINSYADQVPTNSPKPASVETQSLNKAILTELPFSNQKDFADAQKGFIATFPDLTIKTPEGHTVWSLKDYAFLKKMPAPATVNPSLWRQANLNMNNGLFKVTDNIYQVRGFDLANMDIIEGNTGLIIIDPLTSLQTAKAALDLYFQHRPKRPIVAVIYTHSHADHYAGVRGVITPADVASGKVKLIAPQGFLAAAISENVYAGNAMSRRAIYMYGALLPKGENGQVDGALGKTVSLGEITLIPPSDIISKADDTRVIDGVEIQFHLAPNTEAPAEMLLYFPKFKALCAAEDATHTMHNLYTLRGAQVRDAAAWWKTLNDAIHLYGDKSDVIFAQHHWPMWGSKDIVDYLSKQRDLYKYLHDQTLHLMNQGYTLTEVGNMLKLPKSLSDEWYNRGYYGTVSHDAKAVYQRYLGWYDSNPSHLNELTPVEAGKRYVDMMGGADAVINKAKDYYNKGDYRWVAQVVNHVVFADPSNQAAKNLEADALEQLGYQTENATWRNEYLMGAYELRNGIPASIGTETASADTLKAMPIEMFLDYMGIKLDGARADGKNIKINLNFTDTKQQYALELENSVLIYTPAKQIQTADATLNLSRDMFNKIILKETNLKDAVANKAITMAGNKDKLAEFMGLFDTFPPMFNIVTPN